jgi:hypothetical protein
MTEHVIPELAQHAAMVLYLVLGSVELGLDQESDVVLIGGCPKQY